MKLKNAPNDAQSMSQDGDAILRSLQNKSLPVIDLMVREALQNSLDATLKDVSETEIEFSINKFETSRLASHFEGIEDILQSRYKKQEEFIAISDKNTYGLTGDYKSSDANILNKSNFHKLVFGIGKNQEADGAGGSWGLGKTSFFRLGIGIVIYYTRVKIGDNYEERLIASLIESPKQNNRLLPNNGRGIAWWGEYSTEESLQNEPILPITKGEKIEEMLEIFNLKRYINDETGTTIIVPYVGCNEMFTSNPDEERLLPWETSYELNIRTAVERWYNPRLNNEQYREQVGNSLLKCKVNGTGFLKSYNTEPTFDIMHELYTSALLGTAKNDEKIIVRPVFLKKNGMKDPSNNPVGYIAFKEVGREELKMNPPENKLSALEYIGSKDQRLIDLNNSKIIAYCRKPGMVVEYSIDGDWAPKSNILNDETLLLGFFVPNSQGELIDSYQKEGYFTLEQYLRATENADHANWIDEANKGIIRRIKSQTYKAISDYYQEMSGEKQTSATSGLSRKFGKILLPPKNYGKTSAKRKIEETETRNSKNKNRVSDIRVIKSNPIDERIVEVKFKSSIRKESQNKVFLQVMSQEKKMDRKDWEKAMGKSMDFPFEITDLYISTIDGVEVKKYFSDFDDSDLKIYQKSNDTNEIYIISTVNERVELEGTLTLKSLSTEFIPNIAISSEISEREVE
ncbi:hypothetical protein BE24_12050 [Staphylococcus xylosus]|uniref:hypothetical protein n=1 Tax=Staphylococcus xylosus TaxID=1288 RepID=UPI00049B40D2|nr:hypothetical protein [Staphylococcus xylosus]AID02703.1 hypothetical protein BE24_12050 [Staphylococcus xylosus]MEB8148275.1 hypothetical protein [Staphylococcus xylosus]